METAAMQIYSRAELEEKHNEIFYENHNILPSKPVNVHLEPALEDFRKVVGNDNVLTGAELRHFRDPYALDPNAHQAGAGVCPGSVEEIQAVVRIASKYSIALWTVSRGKNLGYGGPAPRVSGSVVLSLHRLNRILEVNKQFAYVVVEPGVTFFDLDDYLRQNDTGLWISVPAIGWGSVLGNTLDRGHGYTPLGDRQHQIESMEVVLASGEIMRTGQWGVTDAPATHLCSNQFGPQIHGLFLQSNLGIVTKLAINVDKAAQTYMNVVASCPNMEDIEQLVDAFAQLYRESIMQNHPHIVNINHFASRDSRKYNQQSEPGKLTPKTIAAMKKKYNTGYWRSSFDFYGTKEMVMTRFNRVSAVLTEQVPGLWINHEFFEGKDGKPIDNTLIRTPAVGAPSMFAVTLSEYNLPDERSGAADGGHIDATLILPSDGKTVCTWANKVRDLMEGEGTDPFFGVHFFDKYILYVQEYVFDKRQKHELARGQKIMSLILDAAKANRFVNYRSHLDHMDRISDVYDYNDHIYRRFVQDVKAALDPKGILSPGKQGIWPKNYHPPTTT